MRKQINPGIIGAFIIGAVGLLAAALFYFSSADLFTKRDKCILYFDSSVNGLAVGAAVKFKGVDIGRVDDIMIRYNQPEDVDSIPVLIDIDRNLLLDGCKTHFDQKNPRACYEHLVQRGLYGRLVYQSYLTGLFYVELDFEDGQGVPRLIQVKPEYCEIPTQGSSLSEVSDLFDQLAEVNWGEIVGNVSAITKRLNEGLGSMDFKVINDKLIDVLDSVNAVVVSVKEKGEPFMNDIYGTLDEMRGTFLRVHSVAASLEEMVHPEAGLRYRLDGALDEMTGAAVAVRALADFFERNPRALLTGKKLP